MVAGGRVCGAGSLEDVRHAQQGRCGNAVGTRGGISRAAGHADARHAHRAHSGMGARSSGDRAGGLRDPEEEAGTQEGGGHRAATPGVDPRGGRPWRNLGDAAGAARVQERPLEQGPGRGAETLAVAGGDDGLPHRPGSSGGGPNRREYLSLGWPPRLLPAPVGVLRARRPPVCLQRGGRPGRGGAPRSGTPARGAGRKARCERPSACRRREGRLPRFPRQAVCVSR